MNRAQRSGCLITAAHQYASGTQLVFNNDTTPRYDSDGTVDPGTGRGLKTSLRMDERYLDRALKF
jgi:hypothetical protein